MTEKPIPSQPSGENATDSLPAVERPAVRLQNAARRKCIRNSETLSLYKT